jgi:hypothetical protein
MKSKINLRNQIIFIPTDKEPAMHIEAFVRDLRILKLNVTILKPMSSVYDLTVTTVLDKFNKSSHCKILNHCSILGISPNITSTIVPTNHNYVVEYEPCDFENECSYRITAKSLNGRKMAFESVYRIKGKPF